MFGGCSLAFRLLVRVSCGAAHAFCCFVTILSAADVSWGSWTGRTAQCRGALFSCATPHTLSCFVALLTFSHSRSPSQLSGHGDDIWGRVSQEACRSCAATSAPTQSRALFLCYTPHPQLLCCLAHTPAVHLNSLGTATKLTTFGGVLSYDSRRKHAAPARLPPTFGVHLSISERFAVLSDVVITMSMSNIVNPPNKVPSGCDSSCHRHSTTTACRHLSCR